MQLVKKISESEVFAKCDEAFNAVENAALKALIAGQMLLELRDAMRVGNDFKPSINGRNQHSEGDGFVKLLEAHYPNKVRNCYNWMKAAERVARVQLGLRVDDPFRPVIDIGGGESMALSHALTAPEKNLPAAAAKFRQDVFDFMADHTLGEATRAALDGESDAKRITLAAGGKSKGGKGNGDRKEFERFVAQKLQHITTAVVAVNQKKGSKLKTYKDRNLSPTQKGLIISAFVSAMHLWPRWLVDAVHDAAKSEAKLSDVQRSQHRTEEQP